MWSKEISSTIFGVFFMTWPGIEPQSFGPLANTLPTGSIYTYESHTLSISLAVALSLLSLSLSHTHTHTHSLSQNVSIHHDDCFKKGLPSHNFEALFVFTLSLQLSDRQLFSSAVALQSLRRIKQKNQAMTVDVVWTRTLRKNCVPLFFFSSWTKICKLYV